MGRGGGCERQGGASRLHGRGHNRRAHPRHPCPRGVTDTCRHTGRRPDLYARAGVPAAHGVARHGDRRGQAGGRDVRDAGTVPDHSIADPFSTTCSRSPAPTRTASPSCTSRSTRAIPAPSSCRLSTPGISPASRGCSASTRGHGRVATRRGVRQRRDEDVARRARRRASGVARSPCADRPSARSRCDQRRISGHRSSGTPAARPHDRGVSRRRRR